MRHVIDLDKLRNNIPHHPTWPTSYDTTDPDEASDCWHALHKWLQTALEGPVSDETTIRAPAAPLNRSDTTQGLPAPNPDTWHADLIHQPGYPLEADPLSALANHHGD